MTMSGSTYENEELSAKDGKLPGSSAVGFDYSNRSQFGEEGTIGEKKDYFK